MRAIRDIPMGTVIDHAMGTIITVEQRLALMRAIGRRVNEQKQRDESLICIPKPPSLASRHQYAYLDTANAGTRLVEYITG